MTKKEFKKGISAPRTNDLGDAVIGIHTLKRGQYWKDAKYIWGVIPREACSPLKIVVAKFNITEQMWKHFLEEYDGDVEDVEIFTGPTKEEDYASIHRHDKDMGLQQPD